MNKSGAARLNEVRETLRKAGIYGAQIIEKIPSQGGLRSRDVQRLVNLGEAEWIEVGTRARWIEETP